MIDLCLELPFPVPVCVLTSSSSAIIDTLVSDVAVLLLLVRVNLLKLPVSPELVELVLAEEREAMVLVRRWELMDDPPKMSPLDEPGRAPKRLRVTASREKRAAREREEAVGVAGMEMFPVLNLNRPNW